MYECTHTQILPLLVSSLTNSYTQFYLHSLGCEFFCRNQLQAHSMEDSECFLPEPTLLTAFCFFSFVVKQ